MNKKIISKAFLDSVIFSLFLIIISLFLIKSEYEENLHSYVYDSNKGAIYNLKKESEKINIECDNLKIKKIFNHSIILKSDGKDVFVCKKELNNE